MRKAYKYRIYPTKSQETILNRHLEMCRKLYNQFLAERKDSWEKNKVAIGYYDQKKTIPLIKETFPNLKNVYSQVLQDVATRIELAFQAFFRRLKSGETPGYPRFKGFGNYNSLTFTQYGSGIKILDNYNKGKISVSGIGHIKTIFHRAIEGIPKTAIIKRSSTGKWYISFSCELEQPEPLSVLTTKVGIDVGIETFAYMSDDTKIENPRFFKKEEKALAKANRKFSKFPKPSKELPSSPSRFKAKRIVSRVHERIRFKRDNFVHQESRKIINKYQIIAVEDLNINRMLQTCYMAKSISDASWSSFFNLLFVKAEYAGRTIVKVNPAYTSQDCSNCGHRKKKSLSERTHSCECCGLTINRDLNASINIMRLGLQSLGIARNS